MFIRKISKPVRLFAALAMMLAMLLGTMAPQSVFAGTGTENNPFTPQDNVAICHAVNENSSNDFISQSPSVNAMFAAGHPEHQNGRDIIPSFYYLDGETVKYFAGLNYDATGQGILANNCVIPGVTPTVTPVTPTVTPVTPTVTPVTPTVTPVTPTVTPVTPTETPVTPTVTPVTPGVTPTETPVTPGVTPTEPPTEAPKVTPAPAAPVTALPSTGTGTSQADQMMLAVAGIAALALIAVGIRKRTEA